MPVIEPPETATADVARPTRSTWSAEVQALRALAVMLVVLFHLWPEQLTGGYIGVDVFFVISGFLITGHLLRDLDRGTFRLSRFYARRVRRLLPAALLVIFVSLAGVLALAPSLIWVETAQQAIASVTYVQNWVLAAQHVDYLNPDIAPTALQHFWSLSVEEQFYLIWPLTLMVASGALLGKRLRRSERSRTATLTGAMILLLVVSLGYAIWVTSRNIDGSYFYSTARIWQFAAGGLLAIVLARLARRDPSAAASPVWNPVVRGLLGWAGFAAIAVAGYTYTADSSVPGVAAVLPVVGVLAVIAAGHVDSPWTPAYLVRFGPVQWLGKVSYSLYLWHWPLIILAPLVLDRNSLRTSDKVVLLGLSILLAGLTKAYVEDRWRIGGAPAESPETARPPRRTRVLNSFAFLVAGTMAVVLLGGFAWWHVDRRADTADRLGQQALAADIACFGAAALLSAPQCADPPLGSVVTPDPTRARETLENTEAWERCFTITWAPHQLPSCSFGPESASTQVVMLGDSHLMQWFPAVQQMAAERGWHLTTYLRSACAPSPAPPQMVSATDSRVVRRRGEVRQQVCQEWTSAAIQRIDADPRINLVITSSLNNKRWQHPAGRKSQDIGIAGYRDLWKKWAAAGRDVVVLRDTPIPKPDVISCVSSRAGADGCSRARSDAVDDRIDPLVAAAAAADRPRIHLLDFTDGFCSDRVCPSVIGSTLVYADDNHITPLYARTLAAELGRRISALLVPGPA